MAKQNKEGNIYDKIFKENAEGLFMPLVEKRLGIKIKHFQPLKEKMQTTIEREMDFFYEVFTEDNQVFILHLEFQTEDDFELLYRAAEYHGMALRRKKQRIRHVVIFLGIGKPKMPTQLAEEEIFVGFDLINIHDFDSFELLSSQVPDVILLAILANYPKDQTESILRLLIRQLKSVCKNPSELSKYIQQLIILSRLRKIEDLTVKITNDMPITYDIQSDYLYQKGIEQGIEQGIEKGIEKGKREFVRNLILNTDFSDSKIAKIAVVEEAFVKNMRVSLHQK